MYYKPAFLQVCRKIGKTMNSFIYKAFNFYKVKTLWLTHYVIPLYLPIISLFLLFISHSCTAHQATNEMSNDTWVIIIGIGRYDNIDETECYADDDANGVAVQLISIYEDNHVKLLVNSDANKSNFINTIINWLDPLEDEDDTIILFLAGEGNSEYFQLYDSLPGSNRNDISSLELNQYLSILESRSIVFIMDFCECGSFSDNLYCAECITSCTGNEKAWEEESYEHGIFSYYLIKAFDYLVDMDTNKDESISVEELFFWVQAKMEYEFKQFPPPSEQRPKLIDSYKDEFQLFKYTL
jgi:hypothetical protein